MKVLVSGASGFIGRHLVRRLLKDKHQVTVVVRKSKKAVMIWGNKVKIVQADIGSEKPFKDLKNKFDWIFHLAAAVSYRQPAKAEYYQVNVKGSRNILRLAKKCQGLKKLVYVSSVGIYGPINKPPADESWPHRPENDYEVSKNKGEDLVRKYIKQGLPVNIIQPTLVYGPGDVNSGMMALFKTVKQRKFIKIGKQPVLMHPAYVNNVVEALILAAKTKVSGETFIIGDEKALPLDKMAEMMAKILKVKLLPIKLPLALAKLIALVGDGLRLVGIKFPLSSSTVYFMTHHRAYLIDKAKKKLGYKPIDTKTGFSKTIKWYKEKEII
ncbi:NAD-dependent epimerase/dehydratase family protein [Patescibacteria group bacterium]